MQLVKIVYEVSRSFPQSEMYALSSQMRRCAVSIPSNIAEGSRRGSKKDYRQFILIAYGSASELETQLEIAKMLGYITNNEQAFVSAESLLQEVMKMLNVLSRKLSS